MGLLSSNPRGAIKYFGLTDWWLSSFTEKERRYIDSLLGIAHGDISYTSGTAAGCLSSCATNFNKPGERHIAKLMLAKAEELALAERITLDLHFIYLGMIETFYKDRDTVVGSLELAIEACNKQIDLSVQAAQAFKREFRSDVLPAHTGYTQLAVIRQKQGRLEEAIQLCQQAKGQGWSGDWDNRIARYENALSKPPNRH